ncbi:hypothetical protein N7492_006184 [Penicillium capsulatum]|uniref:Nucleotide-diphospho-sugar transferase domain-containing protein n=1 Tax=Penicillium capsulatum TaxID=69766 RepID=A0A9W9I341_9EURO|nr:hypothetical protein N7492_006184 [Penicillium capsulatum]KAJ6108836.1 hypothetical protein N7512_008673 [Penicillium capsulatum]
MYARIHGYDYKLVQAGSTPHKYGTWAKVQALRDTIRHYEFVVFLDADAMFPYPHIPLEWLFNYWNITAETLVALAEDPNEPVNKDSQGQTLLNTGFVIAQRSARALGLLDAWDSCADDVRYPGCSQWRHRWPHEQGAFGDHIRYDFDRPDDIKELACSEANGCPETRLAGCGGQLVRHYWGAKAHLPAAVQESLMRYLLPHVHRSFIQEHGEVIFKLNESRAN